MSAPTSHVEFHRAAEEEIATGKTHKGLMARAMKVACGNHERAHAHYVRVRALVLREQAGDTSATEELLKVPFVVTSLEDWETYNGVQPGTSRQFAKTLWRAVTWPFRL